jgi:hypothetical protein
VSPCVIRSNCRRPSTPAGAPCRPLALCGGGNVRTWSRDQESRPVSRQANVVGLSTGTRQLLRWARRRLVARRCMIGNANAAVLPVPVWAMPSPSRAARTTGMALAWIGVGVSQPSACSALKIGVLRPRCKKSANVVCFQEATLGRLRRKVDPLRNARDPLLGDTPRALGCRIGVWGAQQEDDSARVLVRPSRGWSAANRSIERSRLISCCDAQVKRDGNLKAMTTKLGAPTVDGRDAGGQRTLPPSISALYFGSLFRHDEDLNSAAEGVERTAD